MNTLHGVRPAATRAGTLFQNSGWFMFIRVTTAGLLYLNNRGPVANIEVPGSGSVNVDDLGNKQGASTFLPLVDFPQRNGIYILIADSEMSIGIIVSIIRRFSS